MRVRRASGTMARAAAVAALLALAGCSHLHWPWHRSPPPPPASVHYLDVSGSASPPQYWKRNTLLIDLSGAGAVGSIELKPTAGNTWPVRLAFRVMPGAFGSLEVRGSAREVLPIAAAGTRVVDLELPPGIYGATTPQILVSWGPAASVAPTP